MKTIKDIFYGENGLLTIFNSVYPTEYNEYFADTNPEIIDTYVLYRYGDKLLNKSITLENCINFVTSIITMYLPIWEKIKNTLNLQYNVSNSESETHTKTGTIQRIGDNSNETLNAEKCFNDTDFVNDNKTTVNTDTDNTETYNLIETITRQNADTTNAIRREIDFRRENTIQFEIINNLINAISLKIY